MIQKNADLFQGGLPEPIKDLLWDDESGLFENLFRWGGRGLMFVSGPLAILNVAAGFMGAGLDDIGRAIDQKLQGRPMSELDPKRLAKELVDENFSGLEARAEVLLSGIVSLGAKPEEWIPPVRPKGISFEAGQPVPTPKSKSKPKAAPAPVDFGASPSKPKTAPSPVDFAGVPPQPAPQNPDERLEFERAKARIKDEGLGAQHKRRMEYVGLSFDQQVQLRKIDQLEADAALDRKKAYDEHHAKMSEATFARDRDAMEHQIKTKYDIEEQYKRDRQKFDLHRDLIAGKITPEQHKLLISSLVAEPLSYKDIEKAKKGMSKAQRDIFEKQLKQNELVHKQNLRQRAEMGKVDMRNAKLMGAARAGDKGLLRVFSRGVGKAGLVAALAAIIYAGFQLLSAPSSPSFAPGPQGQSAPMARHKDPEIRPGADVQPKPAPSNKRPRSISRNVNEELRNILGD